MHGKENIDQKKGPVGKALMPKLKETGFLIRKKNAVL